MTTLAANKERRYSLTQLDFNELPAIGSDILYQGSAIGRVDSTGYQRPLVGGDRFVGFADGKADNNLGASGDINVNLRSRGRIQLPVSGAVITDVGQPVYATDDDTFVFSPVGASFIGRVHRFVSAGVVIVAFDADTMQDPYAGFTHVLKSANYTVDATDTGKWIWVDTDAVVITLPAVEGINFVRVGNLGAFGTVGVSIAPNSVDMIEGPGITAADNKKLINTKATARRGDWAEIAQGDANGWSARVFGTWAREA